MNHLMDDATDVSVKRAPVGQQLEQNDAKTGLATMCIGTGQGIATVIERG